MVVTEILRMSTLPAPPEEKTLLSSLPFPIFLLGLSTLLSAERFGSGSPLCKVWRKNITKHSDSPSTANRVQSRCSATAVLLSQHSLQFTHMYVLSHSSANLGPHHFMFAQTKRIIHCAVSQRGEEDALSLNIVWVREEERRNPSWCKHPGIHLFLLLLLLLYCLFHFLDLPHDTCNQGNAQRIAAKR